MLNANAKKLVKALRSGRYRQTVGRLHDRKGFCCLGVACDLHLNETGGEWKDSDVGISGYMYRRKKDVLPSAVQKWLGFQTEDGRYMDSNGEIRYLTMDNDESGLTFKEIADVVESEPKGLFVKKRGKK